MDRSCDEFLPGSVLAVDQDSTVGWRGDRDLVAKLSHRFALAHHQLRPVDTRPQRLILRFEFPLPQRVSYHQHRLVQRQRLFDEVECPHLDRANRRFDVAVARDEHDLSIDLPFPQPSQGRETIHAGQPDVEDDEVDGLAGYPIKTVFSAGDGVDCVSLVAQDSRQRCPHARLVVNDQDGWLHLLLTWRGPTPALGLAR